MSPPFAPHAFSMTFRKGLFAHWPYDPEQLRPHVPAPLELDTYDGRAWVTLVPFVLARAGLRGSPPFARLTFGELNVRTYVRFDGTPGLYFFSVDADDPVVPALVRGTSRLPCYHADVDVRTEGGSLESPGDRTGADRTHVDFRSVRRDTGDSPARFEATYRPDGDVFHAEPGTLDYWLAERRQMFDPVGTDVFYADIAHDPWPLQPADLKVRENAMFDATDLPDPDGEPRVRYADELSITGSIPRRIRGLEGGDRVRPPELAQR